MSSPALPRRRRLSSRGAVATGRPRAGSSSRGQSPVSSMVRLFEADLGAGACSGGGGGGGEDEKDEIAAPQPERLVPRPKLRIKPLFSRERVLGRGEGAGPPEKPPPRPPQQQLPPYLKRELIRGSGSPGSPSETLSPISCVLNNERLKRMHFKMHNDEGGEVDEERCVEAVERSDRARKEIETSGELHLHLGARGRSGGEAAPAAAACVQEQ